MVLVGAHHFIVNVSQRSLMSLTNNVQRGVSNIFTRNLTTTEIAGTGDPYATTIKRRREIKDPSMPNFEHVECLKWTNWRMLKDVKKRHFVANYAQYRMNMKSLAHCQTLPSVIRDIALEERNSTPRYAGICQIVNRCSLTSRPRGKWPRYRLSRIVWRDLADHGLLSGSIRAKWG